MCIAMDSLVQETDDCDNQDQTLVFEPVLDQTLVTESAIGKSLDGYRPDFEETEIDNVELERGCEPGSDNTSSNFSFTSLGLVEEEEVTTEDWSNSGMYQDVRFPIETDDKDWDRLDHAIRGYPLAPDPLQMWEKPRGQGFGLSGVRRCYLYQERMHLSWLMPMWGENNNKEENNSCVFGSDLEEVTPAMVGAGLSNLGNTCFLNAILQCFTHTVPLIEGLRSYNHPKPCELESEGFCVFCALHNHIELAITSKGKNLSPLKFVENLDQLSSVFRRYQQEDAHELLQSLLDKLDRCCNDSNNNDSDKSLVQQLFGGRLVSKLKCCNCGHCSDTFESLIDLSLEIEDASSLARALESFTKVEKIEDEESQFECERCKEKVTVEKQLMVDHAPSIATFHLKRFKNDGSRVEKIDKHVEFPLELDLKPYTSGGQNDNMDLSYSLYAIVEHSGFSPTSGHYFSFVRCAPDAWFRLDDCQVTRVSESRVLSRDAYILLYAKNGTPWFSTFMETEKFAMDCNASSTSPKSVLENANLSSESSPIIESDIMSEVNEEDRSKAMVIYGSSFNHSKHKEKIGSAKSDSKIGKKLFSSSFGGGKSVISSTPFKSVFDMDRVAESSPTMGTNICTYVNEDDKRDAMEVSWADFHDCGHENRTNEAKNGSKIETSLSSPACRVDNSNRKDREFTRKANLVSSISRRSNSIGISKLSFNVSTPGDRGDDAKDDSKLEKKPSPIAFRGEVGRSADVNSSSFSGKPNSNQKGHLVPCKRQWSNDKERKEANKLVKGMACPKRRLQLMAFVNSNPEICSSNKKTKIDKKDGPSNALRNPNLVPLRRPVAPGRF